MPNMVSDAERIVSSTFERGVGNSPIVVSMIFLYVVVRQQPPCHINGAAGGDVDRKILLGLLDSPISF